MPSGSSCCSTRPPGEDGKPFAAIEALIQDADRRVQSMKQADVRDAALIAAAQLLAHYEIAGYVARCTRPARLDDAADLLQQTLDDERAADERWTEMRLSSMV